MATTLKQFTNRLEKLPANLSRRRAISNCIGEVLTADLRQRVAAIPQDLAHYPLGAANSLGRVVNPSVTAKRAVIRWTGPQVYYLEFGTGIRGVGEYPDGERMSEAGYAPQPWGHSHGNWWILPTDKYRDAEGNVILSSGWKPYAPFYKTMLAYKSGEFNAEISKVTRETIKELL